MNIGKQLFDLQQIDLDLVDKTEKLSRVEDRLRFDEVLAKAQTEYDEQKSHLNELQKKLKTVEWKVDDIRSKLSPLEKKLYAGSVGNPKELLNLQEQVANYKSQKSKDEDEVLEIMGQIETQQEQVALKNKLVENVKKESEGRQKDLQKEKAEIIANIESANQKRIELVKIIEPSKLVLYETLKSKKQGQAVSRIEQGRCQGCRISLPMSDVQQTRLGGLVQCSSCSRILYIG